LTDRPGKSGVTAGVAEFVNNTPITTRDARPNPDGRSAAHHRRYISAHGMLYSEDSGVDEVVPGAGCLPATMEADGPYPITEQRASP